MAINERRLSQLLLHSSERGQGRSHGQGQGLYPDNLSPVPFSKEEGNHLSREMVKYFIHSLCLCGPVLWSTTFQGTEYLVLAILVSKGQWRGYLGTCLGAPKVLWFRPLLGPKPPRGIRTGLVCPPKSLFPPSTTIYIMSSANALSQIDVRKQAFRSFQHR